jgi:ubiquinone/menaquinone biosynthesis C-methylase UbiE
MVDQSKLQEFLGRAVGDMGAALSAILTIVGERQGLYKAMAGHGSITTEELAEKTGANKRLLEEWLANQAAGGYITYDPLTTSYTLPEEQALALANEESPVYLHGFFEIVESLFKDIPKINIAFRTGKGLDWGDHDAGLFEGTYRFFKPSYLANLTASWIPALNGTEEKLRKGGLVADIGCGYGATTLMMARTYPKSTFLGFDYHGPSIQRARQQAKNEGMSDRTKFEVASATDFPGREYYLVTTFDALHDMGDPVGAAKHVRQSLKRDGAWLIAEPFSKDKLEDNLHPLGRLFYAASTMICVPAALAQNGQALGNQAGETKIREVVTTAGFTRFRRAAETPFNIVYEARP